MQENTRVSIIVPVYNVEPYLRKCVDSIINQTYQNLEIILVDDGSPDNCPHICDEYKEKDKRVVVIHKPNGGLSDARNAGLDAATGEYVTFIDSDDWYAPDALETLVALSESGHYDVVCMRSAFVSTDLKDVEQVPNDRKITVITSHELIKMLCKKKISTSVCNKLFRRDCVQGKRFKKARLNEDYLFLCDLLMDNLSAATIDYLGYFYYSRPESLTHSRDSAIQAVLDAMENALELKRKAAEIRRPDLEKAFARMALYQARTALIMVANSPNDDEPSCVKKLTDCISECEGYILFVNLSLIDKVILLFAARSISGTRIALKNVHSVKDVLHGKKKPY